MSAIGNSNYYEMVWVHPDIECLQLTSDVFLDGYKDGLHEVDSEGLVDVPDGPGMGVTLGLGRNQIPDLWDKNHRLNEAQARMHGDRLADSVCKIRLQWKT